MSTKGDPIQVFISMGSNLAPEQNLPRAVKMLRQNYHLRIDGLSRVYESAAINARGEIASDQPAFLNAAVLVQSDGYYGPLHLKFHVLRFIELCLGRARRADKFAPRVIDLDIAFYGGQVIENEHLHVPDPGILTYAHLALPLADLAPEFVHPVTGQTLAAIAAPLAHQNGITVRTDLHLER